MITEVEKVSFRGRRSCLQTWDEMFFRGWTICIKRVGKLVCEVGQLDCRGASSILEARRVGFRGVREVG